MAAGLLQRLPTHLAQLLRERLQLGDETVDRLLHRPVGRMLGLGDPKPTQRRQRASLSLVPCSGNPATIANPIPLFVLQGGEDHLGFVASDRLLRKVASQRGDDRPESLRGEFRRFGLRIPKSPEQRGPATSRLEQRQVCPKPLVGRSAGNDLERACNGVAQHHHVRTLVGVGDPGVDLLQQSATIRHSVQASLELGFDRLDASPPGQVAAVQFGQVMSDLLQQIPQWTLDSLQTLPVNPIAEHRVGLVEFRPHGEDAVHGTATLRAVPLHDRASMLADGALPPQFASATSASLLAAEDRLATGGARSRGTGGGRLGGREERLQLLNDLGRGREPTVGIRLGQPLLNSTKPGREARLGPRLASVRVGAMAEDQFVQDDSERELIGTVAVGSLGREVRTSASSSLRLKPPHHSVVDQLPLAADPKDVGRLDVAMSQAGCLQVGEPLGDRKRHVRGLEQIEPPLLLRVLQQGEGLVAVGEERAVDHRIREVHHAVDEVGRLTDVLRPDEVLLALANPLPEVLKPLEFDLAAPRRDELDGDRVAGVAVLGDPNGSEASLPDLGEESEVGKFRHRMAAAGFACGIRGGRGRERRDSRNRRRPSVAPGRGTLAGRSSDRGLENRTRFVAPRHPEVLR